jgi:hypothetical protein
MHILFVGLILKIQVLIYLKVKMIKAIKFHHLLAVSAISLITACGGGGGGEAENTSASDSAAVATDAQIRQYVNESNILATDPTNPSAGTVRWTGVNNSAPQIPVYIPAPTSATETDFAAKVRVAIADTNRKTGGRVALTEVNTLPSSGGFFRVSYLTGYVPPGSTNYAFYCANVSYGGPGFGNNTDANAISTDYNNKIAWINLGNGFCDVTQSTVTHELGHALGLRSHFEGFGYGDAISASYWDTLTTLYANPLRTTASQLVIYRSTP